MKPTRDTLIALTSKLVEKSDTVATRIGPDGEILGWRGFHLDLDDLEETIERLREVVRQ